jgi:hypothetical protein
MNDERNRDQIVRKDARGCFAESLSDAFGIGKAHFAFSAYDIKRPSGQRQTDCVHIYIDVSELLELCREAESGELRAMLREKRQSGEHGAIYQHLGGTPAERLRAIGRERTDGMSLSRTFQLLPGAKAGFLLVADSGPGEENAKGLIVPRFGNMPENHVAVSLSFAALCELLLMTRSHYQAWLTAQYVTAWTRDEQIV